MYIYSYVLIFLITSVEFLVICMVIKHSPLYLSTCEPIREAETQEPARLIRKSS